MELHFLSVQYHAPISAKGTQKMMLAKLGLQEFSGIVYRVAYFKKSSTFGGVYYVFCKICVKSAGIKM